MKYNISRLELAETTNLYKIAQKTEEPSIRKSLTMKLTRMGLSPNASRLELAQRKKEIESERGLDNLT